VRCRLPLLCGVCCHCPLRSCLPPTPLCRPPAAPRLTHGNTCTSDSPITAHPRSSAAHSTQPATQSYSTSGPPTGFGLLHSIPTRPGSMWLDAVPTPPPFAWATKPSRTSPAFAWESAHSCPWATHGRALAIILWKTTMLRMPSAATGLVDSCTADMMRPGGAAQIRRPPGIFLQTRGAVFSASSPHPEPPPGALGLPLQPMRWPRPRACRCLLHYSPAASYLRSAARTPGHAAAFRDADKRREYYAHHACPGYACMNGLRLDPRRAPGHSRSSKLMIRCA
jgi:hypothetical protein